MGNAEIYDFENHMCLFFELKKEKWDNKKDSSSLFFYEAVGVYRVAPIIHKAYDFWKEMVAVINQGKCLL